MVALNFDRLRPATMLNLNGVASFGAGRGRTGPSGSALGSRITEAMASRSLLPALAGASRTVGSPQIRTAARSAGTSEQVPGRYALPPLLLEDARSTREPARLRDAVRRVRRRREAECPGGRTDRRSRVPPRRRAQTFMKVGTRTMVIAVVSLAVRVGPRATRRLRIRGGPVSTLVAPSWRRRPSSASAGRGAPDYRRAGSAAYRRNSARRASWIAASREARADGQRRGLRGRRLGGKRESLPFALRERLGLPGSKNARQAMGPASARSTHRLSALALCSGDRRTARRRPWSRVC